MHGGLRLRLGLVKVTKFHFDLRQHFVDGSEIRIIRAKCLLLDAKQQLKNGLGVSEFLLPHIQLAQVADVGRDVRILRTLFLRLDINKLPLEGLGLSESAKFSERKGKVGQRGGEDWVVGAKGGLFDGHGALELANCIVPALQGHIGGGQVDEDRSNLNVGGAVGAVGEIQGLFKQRASLSVFALLVKSCGLCAEIVDLCLRGTGLRGAGLGCAGLL